MQGGIENNRILEDMEVWVVRLCTYSSILKMEAMFLRNYGLSPNLTTLQPRRLKSA
jgi:hypothetical protein